MALYEPAFSAIQRLMWNCEKRRQCYISGRRAGKTHVALLKHLDLAIRVPGSRSWYAGPNYPLIKPLAEQLTDLMVRLKVLGDHSRQDHVWMTTTGGFIQFKSADEPEMLRGWDCDLVTLDESSLCKELAYTNALIATNVRRGQLCILSNVPEPQHPGYDWVMRIQDEWSRIAECETAVFPEWANEAIYPGGRYDPQILELERALAPAVFARHVAGDMRALTGIVYPEFNRAQHLIDAFSPSNCVVGVDPAFGNPAAILFGSYDGKVLTIYHEVYAPGMTDPQICELLSGWSLHPELIVVDKADPGLVAQLNDRLWGQPRLGIKMFAVGSDSESNVHAGIFTVKTWFHQGRIRICRRCEKTLWELERYTFTKSEQPLKLNDHAMDALRYLVTTLDAAEHTIEAENQQGDDVRYVLEVE